MGTVFSPFKYNWVQWNTVCCAQWIISLKSTGTGTAEYLGTVGIYLSRLLQNLLYVQTTVSCNIFSYFFWHGMLCYWVPTNLKTSPPGLMFFKHIRGSIMCTCFRNQGVKGQKMTSMIFFSQFILFFVSSILFSLRSDFLLDVYNKNFTPCIVMCCG